MKTIALIFHFSLLLFHLPAQTVTQKLQKAFTAFEKDTQLTHALSSLYVIDAQTGSVVFDKNSRIGLAPASTQKIITSVTAFELLGKDYRYKTELSLSDTSSAGSKSTFLYVTGYGDPTLGSWRYLDTKEQVVINRMVDGLKSAGIKNINGMISVNTKRFNSERTIPNGWIWEDIGNYYGAGASSLNWRENQYDIFLKSGKKVGDSVIVTKLDPPNLGFPVFSNLKSAPKGSGDNAYAYFTLSDEAVILNGTIPVDENNFSISGTLVSPSKTFLSSFVEHLQDQKLVEDNMKVRTATYGLLSNNPFHEELIRKSKLIYTHYSPTLDSIIYWFNKKSINLYGEALIKTFAYEKQGFGSTDSGVAIVQKFWKEKGLSDKELNIVDGSGLSPLNRVTTHAQVEILKYAKSKDWFPYFYNSLPEYNGMKIKSGTIHDVKGFCGYHKAKNGKEYIFSFLVNNYNGSAGDLVKKMYTVLDNLK